MIVAVAVVRVVQVAVYQVVGVVAVGNALVTAIRTVYVAGLMGAAIVLGRALVGMLSVGRDAMIVDVIAVKIMDVAIVKVIGMPIVANRRMATVRAVRVCVPFVFDARCRRHHRLLRP